MGKYTRCIRSSAARQPRRVVCRSRRSSYACCVLILNASVWHLTAGCSGTKPASMDAAAYGKTWARARGTRPDSNRAGLRPGQAAVRPPARRDLVLSLLRRGPSRMRSPRRPEHRGSLPSLRQVLRRRSRTGEPPHRAVHAGVGTRRSRRSVRKGDPCVWPVTGPEALVRNGIAVGGIGS